MLGTRDSVAALARGNMSLETRQPSVSPPTAFTAVGAEQAPARRAEYPNERVWRRIFRDGNPTLHGYRRVIGLLPSPPRCNACRVPFEGFGGLVMRLRGIEASASNTLYCNRCNRAIRAHPGATDVTLSMVFADVRGSTALAAQAEHEGRRDEYVRLLRHFEAEVRAVFERTRGFIIDIVGDEVVAVYPPGLSGSRHADHAVAAALALTRLGARAAYGRQPLPPFGVGVHTGEVFLGNRFSDHEPPAEDLSKVRIIGEHANLTARLAAAAESGEAIVSDETIAALSAPARGAERMERRRITVKGLDAPVGVHVMGGR